VRILAAILIALATSCVTINANQPPPPVAEGQPAPSAVCRDGTNSYSAHRCPERAATAALRSGWPICPPEAPQ